MVRSNVCMVERGDYSLVAGGTDLIRQSFPGPQPTFLQHDRYLYHQLFKMFLSYVVFR